MSRRTSVNELQFQRWCACSFCVLESLEKQLQDEAENAVGEGNLAARAVAFLQWPLVLFGIAAVVFPFGGGLVKTNYLCTQNATNARQTTLPPIKFEEPFRPENKTVSYADTASHIHASMLLLPVAGTALVLSTVLTFWKHWNRSRQSQTTTSAQQQNVRRLERVKQALDTTTRCTCNSSQPEQQVRKRRSVFGLGVLPPRKSSSGANTAPGGQDKDGSSTGPGQSESTDNGREGKAATTHGPLGTDRAQNDSHNTSTRANSNEGLSEHGTKDSDGDQGAGTSPGNSERVATAVWSCYDSLPPIIRVALIPLQILLWIRREKDKRGTLPQWLLYITTFLGLYLLIALVCSTIYGWSTPVRILVGGGFGLLLFLLAAVVQRLQDLLVERFRNDHLEHVEATFTRMLLVGSTFLLFQVLLWFFFFPYGYETLPCLPSWHLPFGGARSDTRYVFQVMSLRFWGTFDLSIHCTLSFVWWLLQVCAARTTLSRLLHRKESRTSSLSAFLLVLATITALAAFSTVFSEQATLLLVEDPEDLIVPILTIPLNNLLFMFWAAIILVLLAGIAIKRFGWNKEDTIGYILVSYCEEDKHLGTTLLERLKEACRDEFPQQQVEVLRFLSKDLVAEADEDKGQEDGDKLKTALEKSNTTILHVPILSCHDKDSVAGSVARLCKPLEVGTETYHFFLNLVLAHELKQEGRVKASYSILSGGLLANGRGYGTFFDFFKADKLSDQEFSQLADDVNKVLGKRDNTSAKLKRTPKGLVPDMLDKQAFVINDHGVPSKADEAAMKAIAKVFASNAHKS